LLTSFAENSKGDLAVPVMANLRAEAAARGVHPSRLVFAPRLSKDRHQKRLQLADLFLDHFLYGAHSTAADALWAYLPILTLKGEAFPSRVAASLLAALSGDRGDLEHMLAAESVKGYENIGLTLSGSGRRRSQSSPSLLSGRTQASHLLGSLKKLIAKRCLSMPLFDTARITDNLDRSFKAMWTVHQETAGRTMHIVVHPKAPHRLPEDTLSAKYRTVVDAGAHLLQTTLEGNQNFEDAGAYGHAIERAEAHFQRVLGENPFCSDCWHLLGLSKFEQAKTLAERVSLQDSEPPAAVEAARVELEETALAWVGNAVVANPNVPMYRENLASMLFALGRGREGVRQLRDLLYIEPTVDRFSHAMRVFREHESWSDVVEVYEHFRRNSNVQDHMDRPAYSEARVIYGLSLARTGRGEAAVTEFRHTFEEDPSAFDALMKQAIILDEMGEYDRAIDTFLKGVNLQNVAEYKTLGSDTLAREDAAMQPCADAREMAGRRPHGIMSVAIYCHEYGQTWWPAWGPSSIAKGVGGSEEAVIFLARELQKRGLWVEVYANPSAEECGMDENGVLWLKHHDYNVENPADVFVAWRYHISIGVGMSSPARFVWLQDVPPFRTFTPAFVDRIHGIFVLSEFHKSLLPDNGARAKALVTGNALNPAHFADGRNENHAFIYGSAPNRGLETVLTVWPQIKAAIPDATLAVYYGFTKAFVTWGSSHMGRFVQWRSNIERLLEQPGVQYHGLVNHTVLAEAYAQAGFVLYPTVYPETGCVSLMKAQAMGSIPITSRYDRSTLPELCGDFDLGPITPLSTATTEGDPEWMKKWVASIIAAATTDQTVHRQRMIATARSRFLWSRIAELWHGHFFEAIINGGR
jgi:glycosyltransferase involved in cell wall biosynthesis